MSQFLIITISILLIVSGSQAQNKDSASMLLNKSYVDLKGKTTTTILVNETTDTLKLNYTFFNWFPYTETRDVLIIPPNGKFTINLIFNFPDFIRVGNHLTIFNGPGDSLICRIKKYNSPFIEATYTGKYASENGYYTLYNKVFGGIDQEGKSYYAIADHLQNWNLFPAKGDSITQVKTQFLNQYKGSLPPWFKKHEQKRLLFNNYFRLNNALISKQFYSQQKISVNDAYYSFEKQLDQVDDMVLNETYLYCMSSFFTHQAELLNFSRPLGNIRAIEKLYSKTNVGDVNLMRALGLLYRDDKSAYDEVIPTLKFKEPERKIWLDSAIQFRLGNPVIGRKPPEIVMKDVNDKPVAFADYKGQTIIVNFWAQWCGPCIAEFPQENKLYQQYKGKGLVVMNVCFDSDKAKWKQLSKQHNLQMVNLYTAKSDYLRLLKLYNLTAPPRSILINTKGIVTDNYLKRASLLTEDEMKKILYQY